MPNTAITKPIFFISAILLASIATLAQRKADVTISQLFDDFGDEPYGSVSARMDNVAVTLANMPNVKAYIVVYRGRNDSTGLSHRYAYRLKNYLDRQAEYRGFTANRVIAIDGGRRDKVSHEIWLVPEGATPPVPSTVLSTEKVKTSEPFLFDQYPMQSEHDEDFDMWDGRHEDAPARLDSFAAALKSLPKTRGYILAHAQSVYVFRPTGRRLRNGLRRYVRVRSRKLGDPVGSDINMAKNEKAYLVKKRSIDPYRLIALGCGYSKAPKSEPKALPPERALTRMYVARGIELWIVPSSANPSQIESIEDCRKRQKP